MTALVRTFRSPFARRKGGVAPFVAPQRRVRRSLAVRRWRRRGFVPVSPGRPKVAHRILPRTVIGISFTLLAFAVGTAFSGAAFYAYYDNRLAQNEQAVSRFVETFDDQFTDATASLDELRLDSIADIRAELAPLGELVTEAQGVRTLPGIVGGSVWTLETRDSDGVAVVGSAFAVAPHSGGTALVTSYDLVEASTVTPSPPIELSKGEQRITASLWAWDVQNDLAIVTVGEVIPPLDLADDDAQVNSVGLPVFAVSGVGGRGATASPGLLIDQAVTGLQHTAAVGALFEGGPLVTGDGLVVGLASTAYRPYGVEHGQVLAAPGVTALCARVLTCAEGIVTLD
ncbi:MAG: serine protease [Actinomycetota bacterium]